MKIMHGLWNKSMHYNSFLASIVELPTPNPCKIFKHQNSPYLSYWNQNKYTERHMSTMTATQFSYNDTKKHCFEEGGVYWC